MLRLGDHFEIGIPFSFLPVETATDILSDSNGNSEADSYGLNAWTAGLNGRYLVGPGPFRPFLLLGVLFTFLNVDYSNTYNFPNLTAGTATGSFSGTGLGAQAQIGADWRTGNTFVVSFSGGYQFAGINSLDGTLNNTAGQLETLPTAGGRVIAPVSNGTLAAPVFTDAGVLLPGTAVPAGAERLEVDLSGFKAGLQISAFF